MNTEAKQGLCRYGYIVYGIKAVIKNGQQGSRDRRSKHAKDPYCVYIYWNVETGNSGVETCIIPGVISVYTVMFFCKCNWNCIEPSRTTAHGGSLGSKVMPPQRQILKSLKNVPRHVSKASNACMAQIW
jgi:hypothetical protein